MGKEKVYCAYDEMVKLGGLKPNPKNPNTHSQTQIEILGKIIKEQGWRQPIKVSKRSGYIVSGHGRYEAALFIGEDEVPVDYQDYDSEESEMADLLADNRIAELAEIDNTALAEIFKDLEMDDVELTGYTEEDIEPLFAMIDEQMLDGEIDIEHADDVPEASEKPVIILGDIWEMGKHRLICGDSTDPRSYENLMDCCMAQLIVTDPPYNVNYEGAAGKIENDNMTDDLFKDFLLNAYSRMFEFCQEGGAAYIFHADTEGANFRKEFENAGFMLKQCLIWVKDSFVMGRQDYQWRHEPILYGWKPGSAHYFTPERNHSTVIDESSRPNFEKMDKDELIEFLECMYDEISEIPTSIFYCDKPKRNAEHPTMKPVKLLIKLIENSSKPHNIVLDPFGGSGSTLIACEATARKARLIELDPKFCDVIVKRYAELTNKSDITLIRDGERVPFENTGII